MLGRFLLNLCCVESQLLNFLFQQRLLRVQLFILLEFQLVAVLRILQLELDVLLLVLHDLELLFDLYQRLVHVSDHPLLVFDLAPQDTVELAQLLGRLLLVRLDDQGVLRLLLQGLVKRCQLFYLSLVAFVFLHEQGVLLHRVIQLRLELLGRSFLLILKPENRRHFVVVQLLELD